MQYKNVYGFKINDVVGDLLIKDMHYEAGNLYLDCVCTKCGIDKKIRVSAIKYYPNTIFHESHIPKAKIDFPIGMVIGDMTVIGYDKIKIFNKSRNRDIYKSAIVCQCNVCGKQKIIRYDTSKNEPHTFDHFYCNRHNYGGLTTGEYARFHNIYICMINRCTNEKHNAYVRYGGRGITCDYTDDKKGYLGFVEDMYESYVEHVKQYGEEDTSLDRIDNYQGYYKENLRWSTRHEQVMNRRNVRLFLAMDPEGNGYITNSQMNFANAHNLTSISIIGKCLNNTYCTDKDGLSTYFGWRFFWLEDYQNDPHIRFVELLD